MGLINCPECGRENVSDSANKCPKCGYGIKGHFKRTKNSENMKQDEINKMKLSEIIITNKKKTMIISSIILVLIISIFLISLWRGRSFSNITTPETSKIAIIATNYEISEYKKKYNYTTWEFTEPKVLCTSIKDDGSMYWVEVYSKAIDTEDNEVEHIIFDVYIINETKEINAATYSSLSINELHGIDDWISQIKTKGSSEKKGERYINMNNKGLLKELGLEYISN